MSTTVLDQLKSLSRQRWTVAVLAAFAGQRGLRFAVLLHQIPISRESLSRTLQAAVKAGWIKRNPGHGHPLRPEYSAAENGCDVMSVCQRLIEAQANAGLTPENLGRWSLPILYLLEKGEDRFNALERTLQDASPRAITQALKLLIAQALIMREVVDGYPPVTRYRLTVKGRDLISGILGG